MFKKVCKHIEKEYVRTVYGDEINHVPGRGIWKCKSCGKIIYGAPDKKAIKEGR
jgi:ribosomal protein L37AE/L43A